VACYGNASQDTSQGETDNAERSLGKAYLCRGHAESSLFHRVEQEGNAHLG
jgi:hypothetical protein